MAARPMLYEIALAIERPALLLSPSASLPLASCAEPAAARSEGLKTAWVTGWASLHDFTTNERGSLIKHPIPVTLALFPHCSGPEFARVKASEHGGGP